MSFFGGFFRGIIITILGTMVVYVIFFITVAPKAPTDAKGFKGFLTQLLDVKGTVSRMQSKSGDYLDSPEVRAALEGDEVPPDAVVINNGESHVSESGINIKEVKRMRIELADLRKRVELLEAKLPKDLKDSTDSPAAPVQVSAPAQVSEPEPVVEVVVPPSRKDHR